MGGKWGGAAAIAFEIARYDSRGFDASVAHIGCALGHCLCIGAITLLSNAAFFT
jgi:hypothetical protein